MNKYFFIFVIVSAFLYFSFTNNNEPGKKTDDQHKVDSLNNLALDYFENNNLKSTILILQKSSVLAKTTNYKSGEAESYNILGKVLYTRDLLDSALLFFKKSITLKKELGDEIGIAFSSANIGAIFDIKGDYYKALENYFLCQRILKKHKKYSELGRIYNNIGLAYHNLNKHKDASNYLYQALGYLKDPKDSAFIAHCYNNIGMVLFKLSDYPASLKNYQKSLGIKRRLNDKKGMGSTINNIAGIYLKTNQPDSALVYLKMARTLIDNMDEVILRSECNNLTALSYFKLGDISKALFYAKESYKLANSAKALMELKNSSETLSLLYSNISDFKSAYSFHVKLKEYSDSLLNSDKEKEIVKLEKKFEIETKLNEIKRREEEEAKIKAAITERRNTLIYSAITIALFLFFIGFFILSKYRISDKVVKTAASILLLITFEFLLVFTDPFSDSFSNGNPLFKLMFNLPLAVLVVYLHRLLEGFLLNRVRKQKLKETEKNSNDLTLEQ